jgi:hypothetical protein
MVRQLFFFLFYNDRYNSAPHPSTAPTFFAKKKAGHMRDKVFLEDLISCEPRSTQ